MSHPLARLRHDLILLAGPAGAVLLFGLPLLAQDLQLGLDRQSPRALEINPPSGWLNLDSRASQALAPRFSFDLWHPCPGQALEATLGYRMASERQLTFSNSAGAAGDVQARLRLDAQVQAGFLYRWERPFALGLELGLGLEERRERLELQDGGLASAGSLDRPWLRGVLRRRFGANDQWFLALEAAKPLRPAPTPSGQAYLQDLDQLGASPNPGTAATAHAPTYGLTAALGFRFGRHPGAGPIPAVTQIEPPLVPPPPAAPVPSGAVAVPPAAIVTVPVLPPPETAPSAPVPPPAPASPSSVPTGARLHFALNRSCLPPQGLAVLHAWAASLKGQTVVVEVIGHADSSGSRSHNLRLSRARAQGVARILRGLGLTVGQVEAEGSRQPLADNATRAGRAGNRRVELRLQGLSSQGLSESQAIPESTVPGKSCSK